MTVTAHVVARPEGSEPVSHPAYVIDPSTDPAVPSIIDVPDFGLYAVGVHPELGPLGMYLAAVGADPAPAPARVVDDRIEVALVGDAVTLIVQGHPLPGVAEPDPAGGVAHSGGIEPAQEDPRDRNADRADDPDTGAAGAL